MKPPTLAYEGSEPSGPDRSQPRSSGKPVMPSAADATKSHSWSGEEIPPGRRQLMPTIAIGSSVEAEAEAAAAEAMASVAGDPAVVSQADTAPARWSASARTVG